MRKCWKSSPEDRLTFEGLSSLFDARLQSIAGYMELRMVLEQPQGKCTYILETGEGRASTCSSYVATTTRGYIYLMVHNVA